MSRGATALHRSLAAASFVRSQLGLVRPSSPAEPYPSP
ncbi:MAG: hypothetical protein AVDCRST_MAG20-1526 [uncultured Acidimicrobiales bacterium]|uniref:Uncharacterized protein n=1 Tax=uncultured Acidimicrobiales bacterium TaxID=310071 RepID=A0A6J4I117_9ACTN|nr:MAG: hypothetical protein AVDCRST_MAG20-1526 [uncultured Acidimicrobiales bacterium]